MMLMPQQLEETKRELCDTLAKYRAMATQKMELQVRGFRVQGRAV